MNKKIKSVFIFVFMVNPSLCFANFNESAVRDHFLKNISQFVTDLSNNQTYNRLILAIMGFLVFLVVITNFFKYIWNGADVELWVESAIWCIGSFAILNFYDPMLTSIWNAAQALGGLAQEVAVGNTDPFFLPMWTMQTMDAIIVPDTSIWDSIVIIFTGFIWTLVCTVLNFIMWLSALYSVFGYALAKMIGLIFIPFIIHPLTRSSFNAWLRFFVGFVILSVLLRMTTILLALLIKAQLSSVVDFDSNWQPIGAVTLKAGSPFMTSCVATGFVGIMFVLSSFSFANQLGSGVGSGAGNINKAIAKFAKFIAGKII